MDEIDTLRKLRAENRPTSEMIDALPHRTANAVRGRFANLFIPGSGRTPWTKEEEDLLLGAWNEGKTTFQISRDLLTTRTERSCDHKLARLRLSQRSQISTRNKFPMSEDEKQKVASLHAKHYTTPEIAAELNRPPSTIRNILYDLELRPIAYGQTRRRWTQADDQLIKDRLSEGLTYNQRRAFFPNRSDDAVKTRIHMIRKETCGDSKRLWTPAEEEHCMRLYSSRTSIDDIAKALGRSISGIKRKLFKGQNNLQRSLVTQEVNSGLPKSDGEILA